MNLKVISEKSQLANPLTVTIHDSFLHENERHE